MTTMTDPVVWQAVPTKELTRLADDLRTVAMETQGVLHTSLQQKVQDVENFLRYLAEQAPYYNEAAGL